MQKVFLIQTRLAHCRQILIRFCSLNIFLHLFPLVHSCMIKLLLVASAISVHLEEIHIHSFGPSSDSWVFLHGSILYQPLCLFVCASSENSFKDEAKL